jgi:hypothetical protein
MNYNLLQVKYLYINYMNYDFNELIHTLNQYNININIDLEKVNGSNIFRNINDCINNCRFINVRKISNETLWKIHRNSEYPIMYLILKRLKELGKLQQLFEFTGNMDNYDVFLLWYREHHHLIDINRLKVLIKSTNDEELLQYYEILYNPPKKRKFVHELLYNNPFVSIDVHQCYECSDIIFEQYKGDNLTINLYRLTDDNESYINRIVSTISIMRCFAEKYNGYNGNLTVTLFLSDIMKKINKNTDLVLCADNINSGSCLPKHFINIWRKEELIKVLIHELIHFHNFDFHRDSRDYDYLESKINNKIVIDGIDSCNESYTESLAVFIYSCIMSTILKVPFETVFNLEVKFLLYQVCKIIKYFNGTSLNDIFRITFVQNTSVRSYFIIKYLVLSNLNKFTKFIDDNGCVMSSKIRSYGDFIDNLLNTTNFLNTDNIFDNVDLNNNTFNTKTLRMSLYDFY